MKRLSPSRRVPLALATAFRSALLRLLALTCPRKQVRGFEVVDLGASGSLEFFTRKVSDALQLIETHDPPRFARIRRDMKRFALIPGGGEFYHHGLNAYVMDVGSAQTRSVSELAATIVHEATHARLMRAGFFPTEAEKEEVERICTEAEASFAEKLPDAPGLAEKARAKLSTRWWTAEAMRSRRMEQFRASGMPKWLLGLFAKFVLRRPDP